MRPRANALRQGANGLIAPKAMALSAWADKMDVFVHMETLRKSGIAVLQEGERLRVVVTDGSKGKHAVWVGRAV